MPALTNNIENRVRKLAKPSNHSQGMQPLFEAVSNAFYAIEDRFGEDYGTKGLVEIRVDNLSDPEKLTVEITDNGIGLDDIRYEAFCTIDTDFKRSKGGKGVGRLFWLDAFKSVRVTSTYASGEGFETRAFRFELNNTEQVIPESYAGTPRALGTAIRFEGLRSDDYINHFPKKQDTFLRYFSAHFIADFLVGSGARVAIDIAGALTNYPKEISDLVVGKAMETGEFDHEEFGKLSIVGFACLQDASTGHDGNHQLHLLADKRTVESRKVDNLLGLKTVSMDGVDDLYFHGCVSGEYLDKRVNEGRTAFNLPESTLKKLSRHCMDQVKAKLLTDQVEVYSKERKKSFEAFVARYPIYGFDETDVQLGRVPFHAVEDEDFAAGLVKYQIRRDEERQEAMQSVIELLDQGHDVPENFSDIVVRAANEIQASEQQALAQHVVRRKLVLELLGKLITRIRAREGHTEDYHLEETLHSFIVPMRIRGDDHTEIRSRAHDLWIVDERFSFTRAFSSDKRLSQFLAADGGAGRPDLVMWDLAFGLGVTDPEVDADHVDLSEPLRKMLIVEFKRPGRTGYGKAEDQIEQQITKYLAELKGGEIETFNNERVRIAPDCIFYCYVIADIVGDLKLQLSSWQKTANGQGRLRPLDGEYRGAIEVVQWQDLVNDAWSRNRAMLHAGGLSRSKHTK